LKQKAPYQILINEPSLWLDEYPQVRPSGHKYDRGHTIVLSGFAARTGAARLAAGAALRIGSGLVTLYSPPDAVLVNAAHLTAVMIKSVKDVAALNSALTDERISCVIAGPALGVGENTCEFIMAILSSGKAVVLDADALTSFKSNPERLFAAIKDYGGEVVLTPHMGEFISLFGGVATADDQARAKMAVDAATISGATIVLKGAATLVASNKTGLGITLLSKCITAPPWLATAGSGDVLAGVIGGLLAQGMPAFDAASCGVWLHGEAANICGPALISEDLEGGLQQALVKLYAEHGINGQDFNGH